MLSDCKSLDAYFQAYGGLLGARARDALAPLHAPDRDPAHPAIATLVRRPFDAQAQVITAIGKAWRRQKSVLLAAEMGTGKTLIACASAHIAAGGRPYRALVMCPDHLLDKWGREVRETVPRAVVHTFEGWRDVLAMTDARAVNTANAWFLLGRDRSKFEPQWKPKVARRKRWVVEPSRIAALKERGATVADLTGSLAVCPKCGATVDDKQGNPLGVGDVKDKTRLKCAECREPLWSFTNKPYRWAPARILHKRMKGRFDYLVIDEAHEAKSADAAQANAAGKLIACSKKVIALTGTLIGGYAHHIFPLTLRLAPASLVADGMGWGAFKPFNARYGRIETTITHTSGATRDGDRNAQSMGSTSRKTERCRPGVMPQLYGDHLIDKCIFLTLEEVSEGLPPLFEEVVPVAMDPAQARAHADLQKWFRNTIKAQLAMGNKRLLGRMLMTLLGYPDHPYGWETITADPGDEFSDVFQPESLDKDVLRPKEEALIALCRREKGEGRQAWVYLQMTDVRDVGPRLVQVLADAGIKAGYLESKVDRRKREEWIYKKGKSLDVVLSHPKLVETGLDLFAKDGNHNYPTLIYYQTGYNLFTLRQSSRRSWRIGQPLPCRTVFLYYAETMQEQAMTLMGKKMAAAEALEGKFSTEGLAAMAGEDDATMALARALLEKASPDDGRDWGRSLGFAPIGATKNVAPMQAAPEAGPTSFTAAELATLKRLHDRLCGVA